MGLAIGERQITSKIAKTMLGKKIVINVIVECTGLLRKEIEKWK